MNRKHLTSILWSLILFSVFTTPLRADSALIPISPIDVYEPGQYAIIAWNNGWEILYLTIVVEGSTNGTALQITPLPSIPEIFLGDIEVFVRMNDLLEAVDVVHAGGPGGPHLSLGDVIALQTELGPHNITVFHIENATVFKEVMRLYASSNSLPEPEITEWMIDDVEYYINKGYRYFCVDLINVSSEDKRITPIVFKFRSPTLYYPMRISAMNSNTYYNLFLYLVTLFPVNAEAFNVFGDVWTSVRMVTREELGWVDSKLLSIFMPWDLYFYLRYIYVLGSSSRLHLAGDVELSPPLLWVILKTMSGIYIVMILILALYDKLRERIIVKNRTAMISILFVLTGSIIVGCNFTVPMIWGPASWTSSSWGVLRRILPKAYEIAPTFLDVIVIISGFALILTLIGVLKGHTELGLRSLRVNLFKLEKIIILLSVTVAVGCYLFIKELEFINREYYFAFMVIVNVILLLSMISLLTSFYILIMIKKLRFRSKIKK